MYVVLAAGLALLATILTMFWLKDRLRSPRMARIVYSELIARLAIVGAALTIAGALMIAADWWGRA